MLAKLKRNFKQELDPWSGSTLFLALIILAPLLTVAIGLGDTGPKWEHLKSTVLFGYVSNTIILSLSVVILATLFAVPSAWLVTAYEFPGRGLFSWALALPLAIPTYVAAFVYYQFPEAAIPLLVYIRSAWGIDAFQTAETLLRYGLLATFMAAVLYPYIYLSARASFSQQRRQVIEAAQTLGRSPRSVFLSIALPLSRPALAAGIGLVVMEVINDYGAVHFFGVPTLTEGIFRTWFGLADRSSALRLAGFIMVVVFAILLLEKTTRGRARFAEPSNSALPIRRRRLKGLPALASSMTCLIPLTLGFLFPAAQLLIWTSQTFSRVFRADFIHHLLNSLLLAFATALVLTALSLLIAYTVKLRPGKWLRGIVGISALGYSIPGAVVAVGVMVSLGNVDRLNASWLKTEDGPKLLLSGTLTAIGFAYIVRFLAVSLQPLQSGLRRVCGSLDEASRTLGVGPAKTLCKINIPLLKGTLIAAFTLVFVDILKELPLTMILRPANFETMATTAFSLAKEGRIRECAVPSFIILITGAIGLGLINRFLKIESP
ncbi:MAG: iron ABC transporter permease [Verrucomicrobiota bacterium]